MFTAVAASQHCCFVLLPSGTLATEQAASRLRTLLCPVMHRQHKTCTVAPNDCTPSRRPAFLSVELSADTLDTSNSGGSSSGAHTAIKRRPVKAQINLGQASLCPLGVDGPHFEVCRLILDLMKRHSLESRGHHAEGYWPPARFPHHCPGNRLFLFQRTIDNNKNVFFLPF